MIHLEERGRVPYQGIVENESVFPSKKFPGTMIDLYNLKIIKPNRQEGTSWVVD
jgi:hypothetical protein